MAGSKFSPTTSRRNGYRMDPPLLPPSFFFFHGFKLGSGWVNRKVWIASTFLPFYLFLGRIAVRRVCEGSRDGGDGEVEIACANLINENTIDKGFKFRPHERLAQRRKDLSLVLIGIIDGRDYWARLIYRSFDEFSRPRPFVFSNLC